MKKVVLSYLIIATFAVSAAFTSCNKDKNDEVAQNLSDGTVNATANSVCVVKWAKTYFLVLGKIFGSTKEEEVDVSGSVISGDESL